MTAVETIVFFEPFNTRKLWRAFFAEFLGTALLVLLSCGTFLLIAQSGIPPRSNNIFLTAFGTGFTIACLDFIFEPTSGAHFNPAFSFALFCIGRMTATRCLMYTLAQLIGGVFGAAALFFVCPLGMQGKLGATILWHGVEPGFGLLAESAVSFLAMFFMLCSDEHREPKTPVSGQSAIRVGIIFTALTLSMMPYTTASMNPARTLGPAILSSTWSHHWIYWVGPYVGATVAAVFFGLCWARKPKHHLYRHGSGIIRKYKGTYELIEQTITHRLEDGDQDL